MAYYNTDLETSKVLAYTRRYGIREHEILKKCRLETLKNRGDASIMTMPEEAAFLAFFVKSMGFKRGLEIGVFTGYSSLSVLMAMPDDGFLTCCEISQECADLARGYWKDAGVDHKAECIVGDAVATVQKLISEGKECSFDFTYIDANKDKYDEYYEAALVLTRPGGIIIIDNMLWGGRVTDKSDTTPETTAIVALNKKLHGDERIEVCLSTMGDGVSFIRKL
ncbi:putative O-methyltransferase YrrM [Alteromonadaceae bacterium 2753L.S.0a.02]|nr:putative O-methyltransferase YrrM [Alteromonadaceae bacterium 2753L.S.0a.02]